MTREYTITLEIEDSAEVTTNTIDIDEALKDLEGVTYKEITWRRLEDDD